jgi:hypothetical protein
MADKQWQFAYKGEVYLESELTLTQAERIEDLLGLSWLEINPIRAAKQSRVILAVMCSDRTGTPVNDVLEDVGGLSVSQFLADVWSIHDSDLAEEFSDGNPPEAGAPSTPTSSRSTAGRGAGRRT